MPEKLSSEFRAQIAAGIKGRLPNLSQQITVEHFPSENDYLNQLMWLAILDHSYNTGLNLPSRFKTEVNDYRNRVGGHAYIEADSLLSAFHLRLGNLEESQYYLEAALDSTLIDPSPDIHDTLSIKILTSYAKSAIALDFPDLAAEVLRKHGSEVYRSLDPKEQLGNPLFQLAASSSRHEDLFNVVADLIKNNNQEDILHLLWAIYRAKDDEETSLADLLSLTQNIQDERTRIIAHSMLAHNSFELGMEDHGKAFVDRLKTSLYSPNNEISTPEVIQLCSIAIQRIHFYQPTAARELLQLALDKTDSLSGPDDFPKVQRAYQDLFDAMSRLSEEAADPEQIPLTELTQIRDHALNRFAHTANFMETESNFAVSMFPRDPLPAEALLTKLRKSKDQIIDPRHQFQVLESMAVTLSRLAFRSSRHRRFDNALDFLHQQIDIEAEMEKLSRLHSDLKRIAIPPSVNRARSSIAYDMVKGADPQALTIMDQITDLPTKVQAVCKLSIALDSSSK